MTLQLPETGERDLPEQTTDESARDDADAARAPVGRARDAFELAQKQLAARVAAAEAERGRLVAELEQWKKHSTQLGLHAQGVERAVHSFAERNAVLQKQAQEQQRLIGVLTRASMPWRVMALLRAAAVGGARKARRRMRNWRSLLRPAAFRSLRASLRAPSFDANYYLQRYPDVRASGSDPYRHFMLCGKAEGRSGWPNSLKIGASGKPLSPDRECVLVVAHEASRTGAPVLAWNICRALSERFDVVTLLLGDGELVESFGAASNAVVGPYGVVDRNPVSAAFIIDEACRRYDFKFAVVNSIASRPVLRALADRRVPSVLLIHEFYKFHCAPEELVDALAWAGRTVFSAGVVRDSAAIERAAPAVAGARILPQGKCAIPARPSDAGAADREVARIARRMSSGPHEGKPFVVLGAGTVEYRKGVDLFIATAGEIRRIAPEANVVMVWIGAVVNFEPYRQYAEFVTEQIERAGLGERVKLLPETPHLEAIYALADVCFIASRIDPLPNIAIDAMTAGTPVICFDRATGVAENLQLDPALSECVLPFLSVDAAARKILALREAPERLAQLGERARALAAERFDMKRYVARLADLAAEAADDLAQQARDVEALRGTDDFVADFYLPRGSQTARDDAIREFAGLCRGHAYIRKPAPGFDPCRYAAAHGLALKPDNPFVHFVRGGRPAGPWQESVLDLSTSAAAPARPLRVAVHIHAFYADLLADIVARLEANALDCDLFVSVTSDDTKHQVQRMLRDYRRGFHDVRVVPNAGRDIGPMLTEFAAELLRYDVIGHLHTKKSAHVAGSDLVRSWVDFLMENLLGGKHHAAARIVAEFAHDEALGLVFPDDPHLIGWDKNRSYADDLAGRLGLGDLPSGFFPFPVGTMFWARPQALQPLLGAGFVWDDYPAEPLPIDGTMLHALERLLPFVAEHAGYTRKVTYVPGVTR